VAAAEKLGSRHQFSLNYSSVGSAEGVKRIQEHTVDFGATDQPLSRQELNSSGLQFPTAIGGVVITANLPAFNVSHATDWT
jgi:phosphate transport system substrate-binding protein